jgi:hypothetical protein
MPPSPLVFTYNNPKSVLLSDSLGPSTSVSLIELESPNLVLQGVTLTLQTFDNTVPLGASSNLLVENITVVASAGTDTLGTVSFVLQYPNPVLVIPTPPLSSSSILKKEEMKEEEENDEVTLEDSALEVPTPNEVSSPSAVTSDDTNVAKTSSYVGGASGIFVEYLFGNVIFQYTNSTGDRMLSIYSSS